MMTRLPRPARGSTNLTQTRQGRRVIACMRSFLSSFMPVHPIHTLSYVCACVLWEYGSLSLSPSLSLSLSLSPSPAQEFSLKDGGFPPLARYLIFSARFVPRITHTVRTSNRAKVTLLRNEGKPEGRASMPRYIFWGAGVGIRVYVALCISILFYDWVCKFISWS